MHGHGCMGKDARGRMWTHEDACACMGARMHAYRALSTDGWSLACARRQGTHMHACMHAYMQELVADVCEEAGYAELDDLVMAYKRPDGEYSTVTRSVTVQL